MGIDDTKRANTANSRATVEIGLLIYPGSQMAAIHGLTDLFTVANRLSTTQGGTGSRLISVSHWQLENNGERIERVFTTHELPTTNLTALILPPSLDTEPGGAALTHCVRWIRERHAEGAIVCSVCAGAFLLAEAGLLNGRSATTHWIHTESLAKRFPEIRVDTDKLLIDDGDIITAGGVMAWVDLGLSLVDRYISPTVMLATSRFLLVDAAGRQQRFYSSYAPRLGHGDNAVLRIQHWLQKHLAEDITVRALAIKANLTERTFLRRFQRATGLTPTDYVQELRIGKARESLEFSVLPIKEVAWMVGYEDPGSFRKVFVRIMGLSPREYRRRFGIAGNQVCLQTQPWSSNEPQC